MIVAYLQSLMCTRLFAILLTLLTGSNLCAQQMTMYVIPPLVPMNWQSPRSLLFSYLNNLLTPAKYVKHRHPMGHVLIELNDSNRYTIAGVVAESKADLAFKVYAQGYGLGILFTHLSGRIEIGETNTEELGKRFTGGDVAYLRFKISPECFDRLWQYMEGYRTREYYKTYNGDNNPRAGKGAGCSAFGMSFVELCNLLPETVTGAWKITANVPNRLVGGPEGGNRWVGVHRILMKGKWADTSRHRYRTIEYYEPTLIYSWIVHQWSAITLDNSLSPEREQKENAKGLLIDCSRCTVPTDPIWIPQAKPLLRRATAAN